MFALVATTAMAQYNQNRAAWECMFKVDLNYSPFLTNPNDKPANGYYLDNMQHMGGINVMGGACLNQDFFVGLGASFNYFFVPSELGDALGHDRMGAQVYVDADYRPLQDEFSPMVYGKAGVSYMMSDGVHGNTMTPLFEAGVGCNWYFSHAVVNMERNYKSLYFTIGVAYMQQTITLPLRVGLRF